MAQEITVVSDMEFVAVYEKITYAITVSNTQGATVVVSKTTDSVPITKVDWNESYKVSVTAPVGKAITSIKINGTDMTAAVLASGFVTVTGVKADQAIVVVVDAKQYTVKFFKKDATTLIETRTVEHGGKLVPPVAPDEPGFNFTEWKIK